MHIQSKTIGGLRLEVYENCRKLAYRIIFVRSTCLPIPHGSHWPGLGPSRANMPTPLRVSAVAPPASPHKPKIVIQMKNE